MAAFIFALVIVGVDLLRRRHRRIEGRLTMTRLMAAVTAAVILVWIGFASETRAQLGPVGVTEEATELRTETAKFFRTSSDTLIAVYYPAPVHRWTVDEEWVDLTPQEIEEAGNEPPGNTGAAGKALTDFPAEGGLIAYPVNGASLVKGSNGSIDWFMSDRNFGKWNTDGRTYRSVFSYLTPIPEGYVLALWAVIYAYRDTPDPSPRASVRILNNISGNASNMYNKIGNGTLIWSGGPINRPQEWLFTRHGIGARLITNDAIFKGRVHIGIHGDVESGDGHAPLSLGKWGLPGAPTWPPGEDFNFPGGLESDTGIPEPNTYTCLILGAIPLSSGKPVADPGVKDHTWGGIKQETSK